MAHPAAPPFREQDFVSGLTRSPGGVDYCRTEGQPQSDWEKIRRSRGVIDPAEGLKPGAAEEVRAAWPFKKYPMLNFFSETQKSGSKRLKHSK